MKKIILIIQREYLTRIRKKIFWVATLLLPLFYFILIFGTGYITKKTQKEYQIAVIDQSGFISERHLENKKDDIIRFKLVTDTNNFANTYKEKQFDGYIIVPPFNWEAGAKIIYKGKNTPSLSSAMAIDNKMGLAWDRIKEEKLGITDEKQKIAQQSKLSIEYKKESGEDSSSSVSSIIAYVCGFLIYLIILIYGGQVMMGVMEEKTNRIAEVVVSSVKPFQLMMGKIIGIGLVGLTQFLLWITFIILVYNIGKSTGNTDNSAIGSSIGMLQHVISNINIPLVIFCFIFYFMGGYFFYASLYAAIASVVNEDVREAQSLSFPITMLIIFSIVLMSPAINDPTGPIAFWGSMIPFSSPIIMLARIPFGVPSTVPYWQLFLSMFILVAGFVFTTWVSAKIYRTGILMYGKKVTLKEMVKWVFRK